MAKKPKPYRNTYFDGPINGAFGLTYAAYHVVPRMVLQSMPEGWQKKFCKLMNELHDTIGYEEPDYNVIVRGKRGRFVGGDQLRLYRHPDMELLTFKKKGTA